MGELRILVVEDDFLSRFSLVKMMTEFGVVEVAVNGHEALEMVKQSFKSKEPYHLILLDIMMPVMSGQEALNAIRKFEESMGILGSSGCKVIMTTALVDAKSIMEAFNGLCEAYVAKPYTRKHIVDQMQKIGFVVK